jgi:hypothetical protein
MPILGTIASSRQTATPDLGAMFPLQVVTVGAATSTITFTNIPNTYTHLQLRIFARSERANNVDAVNVRFNSDTGFNYSEHWLYGDGSSALVYGSGGAASVQVARIAGDTAGANTFGAIIVDVLDYANTNKFKTVRALGGTDNNGNGQVNLVTGLWRNTNAVTSVTLTPGTSTNWKQYSQIALYGLKVA